MKKLLLVLGKSGAGKTTVANYLEEKEWYHFHPLNFLKRWLEPHYDLEYKDLDTQEGKSKIPLGMSISMQEYLVNLFHFMKINDPFFTSRNIPNEITQVFWEASTIEPNEYIISGIVCVGFRNEAEIQALFSIVEEHDISLTVLEINRPLLDEVTSDESYYDIREMILQKGLDIHSIENSGSIEELLKNVDTVLSTILA